MLSKQDGRSATDLGHKNLLKHSILSTLGEDFDQMDCPSNAGMFSWIFASAKINPIADTTLELSADVSTILRRKPLLSI